MKWLFAFLTVALGAMSALALPASAASAYYVMVGYANPQQIAGPYDDLVSCNQAALGYNTRDESSAFHCVFKYSPGASAEQQSRANPYSYVSPTRYNVVYHALTHDRVVSSGYTSMSACLREASSYNITNADYRYGCTIALP